MMRILEVFSVIISIFGAWNKPLEDQEEEERLEAGEEVKGCQLRRGGRMAKAVDLEHSRAKKDKKRLEAIVGHLNEDSLEQFDENFPIEIWAT